MEEIKNVQNNAPKRKRRKRGVGEGREGFTPLTVVMLVLLLLYVFSMFYLIGWTFITSIKHPDDFTSNLLGFPRAHHPQATQIKWGVQFENYLTVLKYFYVQVPTKNSAGQSPIYGVTDMFVFSLVYAIGCAFFKALVPMLMAYMCARFNYFFSKIIYGIVIVTMILPIVGSLPAEIKMAKLFGFYDQLWGLWLMRGNFLGMYFLVFYGNFKALPMGYTEAAKIDGAGNLTILLRIILPLAKTTFFTIFLLHFIAFWNDYNTPLIYMPSYPTIAYGLYVMNDTTINEVAWTPHKMAAAMMMAFPILILFLFLHKRLLGNLTVGGLKG